ncbi:MAG: phosphate ABC transporter permease subunit PstC [Blautia sp.]|nr:phosphate ABC transporter permease subunit PstC [Blautia sp.]
MYTVKKAGRWRRGWGLFPQTAAEGAARAVFTLCGFIVVFATSTVMAYMLVRGIPAIFKVGLKEILFSGEWKPVSEEPEYGILYILLTSVIGTGLAVLTGVPIGILTAVFLAEFAGGRMAGAVSAAVELLAGIPSVIYGLLGIYLLNPLMYKLERKLFEGSPTHQFTGGANLLSAAVVLAVMILPTVVSVSETAIRTVPPKVREASLALGASRVQTVFRSVLPAAGSGVATAVVLGVGRAMGETMAITLVSGNSVNLPLPFRSVRFLTTAIVSEMGYSQGTHREMLFTIGLALFAFIMLVNMALNHIIKKGR